MPSNREDLLERIRADPGDDEIRLVYADVLEQEGDVVQAEYVRLAIANVREYSSAGAERVSGIEKSEGKRFAGSIAEHARGWTFERGLVSTVEVPPWTLGRNADAVLGPAPIRTIKILDSDLDEDAEDAIDSRETAAESDRGEDEDEDEAEGEAEEAPAVAAAAALARCRFLSGVTTIDMSQGGLGDHWDDGRAMTALMASEFLTRLATVIVGKECSSEAARAIAEAHARLPALRELRFWAPLDAGRVGDAGAIAIGESPLCARLEVLEIVGAGVGEEGGTALARGFRSIKQLLLPGTWYVANEIGPEGARALADASGLAGLETLVLNGAAIGDDGLEAIAAASWFARMRLLDLGDNGLTDRGIRALASSPFAHGLVELHLKSGWTHGAPANRISDDAVRPLERLPSLRRITTDDGVREVERVTR